MLDRKFIVENADSVQQNCVNRGVEVDVDRFVQLQSKRKTMQAEVRNVEARLHDPAVLKGLVYDS